MVVDIALKKIFIDTSKDDKNNDNAVSIIKNPVVCSICKSNNVITDPESAEILCSKCGMVISDKIQEKGQESRTFLNNEAEDTRRTGMPTSLALSDMGLSTVIGRSDKDASGYEIKPSMLSTIHRLRTWDFRTQVGTSTDRNLRFAFNELHTLKDKLGLPDTIIEKTAYIYRKKPIFTLNFVQERRLARGRSVSALLAAAIYIACRQMGVPRTLDDIAIISNINRKSIAKCYRLVIYELDIKIPTLYPMKCIVKVANKAVLNEKTKRHAIDVMSNVTKKEISAGKNPMGLAATVLYISCIKTGEHRTQKDISQAAGITDVTLRNGFKDIRDKLQLN
ncbi:MAG: TFIIB-type zinc ribbon-containing protein [Candidatus Nitrosopolaris sp.]